MAANTGAFANLLVPGLRKVFFEWLKDQEMQYDKFLNGNTSKRAFEEDLLIAGLGTMPQKAEGAPVIFQDPIQGNKKRYTHITFALGFRVTREMYDDDLYGPMQRMSKELGRSGSNAREVSGANVLNNGGNTAFIGFNTGESLFSVSHALVRGGTFANRATTDADLGIASLEAGVINFSKQVDESNFPIMVKPKMLVIPPDSQMIAEELLGSEYRPYTATNEINAIRKFGMNYMICHYLTDPDSWFLLAKLGEHDLNFFQRQAIDFQSGDDFDTGDAKYKSTQRFSVGFGDWRGTYGSFGA
jgi:phage major head subunit gpT-like protein